jgi:hypothetical protein
LSWWSVWLVVKRLVVRVPGRSLASQRNAMHASWKESRGGAGRQRVIRALDVRHSKCSRPRPETEPSLCFFPIFLIWIIVALIGSQCFALTFRCHVPDLGCLLHPLFGPPRSLSAGACFALKANRDAEHCCTSPFASALAVSRTKALTPSIPYVIATSPNSELILVRASKYGVCKGGTEAESTGACLPLHRACFQQ